MPPKKGKKIALSEFLGDGGLGSWADEVDALPNAPAPKLEGDYGRDDRFSSRRDDSRPTFSREDIPLPTQPPYTAFIGNLAFDLTESDIESHFSEFKTNSIKIIKDRDDKPKGFGYVEFETLDGLKDALSKTGANLSGRTIRVSVAEPPKERGGFSSGGGGYEDDGKFDNPWRRDGPLPDLGRDSTRRRFDGPPTERAERVPDKTEGISDWRSSRPRAPPPAPDADTGGFKRRGPSFPVSDTQADKEDNWTMGSRFKAAGGEETGSRFGGQRARPDGPPKVPSVAEGESDWRSATRSKGLARSSGPGSPTDSVPSTPQMGRRKLELKPRSGNASVAQTPLSSPKMGSAQPTSSKPNPFGAAKPVDVTQREKQVEEKLEKEKERFPVSRTNSRPATERPAAGRTSSPLPDSKAAPASPKPASANLAPTVRPTLSFASAAAAKKAAESQEGASKDAKSQE
ncbi:hypothetical protein DFP72DRAFT_891753 [Ephemerocybe angulata]|uniref:RRM domain-containing protein n=1 Tax=Ephemerocybe angulata TaxID=980116 RepID=A0A8H6I4B9_9AGAR|nr:hypothetical protein DFP72DRAFT_891753 [Tulosesus angulatus]